MAAIGSQAPASAGRQAVAQAVEWTSVFNQHQFLRQQPQTLPTTHQRRGKRDIAKIDGQQSAIGQVEPPCTRPGGEPRRAAGHRQHLRADRQWR